MDAPVRALVEALHQTDSLCSMVVTGGGASAVALLLAVPGASRTILEATIPYDPQALADYLGHQPTSACSEEIARLLARAARERGRRLAPDRVVVGLGSTASLASDRPKRGDHRFHLAFDRGDHVQTVSLTLSRGARDRHGEEQLLTHVLLNTLAEAFGLQHRLPLELHPGEEPRVTHSPAACPLAEIYRGNADWFGQDPDGRWSRTAPPRLLLPGSFNPLHQGHYRLGEAASARLREPFAFELTVANADKGLLAEAEVRRRLGQFPLWEVPVVVTRATTYLEKARLFPGTVFAIGIDTAVRILDARYYGGATEQLAGALDELRALGCRFLVAGRADADGRFRDAAKLHIPAGFSELFDAIPRDEFDVPLSSTQLRAAAPSPGRENTP